MSEWKALAHVWMHLNAVIGDGGDWRLLVVVGSVVDVNEDRRTILMCRSPSCFSMTLSMEWYRMLSTLCNSSGKASTGIISMNINLSILAP
jgi:hypothetical protein